MSIEIKRIDGTVAHDNCGAQALLVLEPLASFAGAES